MYAGTANKRFHPDEALYTTFARNAFVHGDWLLTSPLDKPPISIYANAISQALFGGVITDKGVYDLPIRVGEFVARIPNLFAGIITVALFIALERKLIGKKPPLASYLFTLTPFFYAFSGSAFTDMLMLMWVMGAWLAIERKQAGLSGFLLALGFATKPQAIFFLPLLIARGLWGKPMVVWRKFALYSLLVIAILLIWDISRGTTSVFVLGGYNYPELFSASDYNYKTPFNEWSFESFREIELILICCPGLNPLIFLFGFWILFARRRWAITIGVFLISYLVLHLTFGLQIYDRYFLPTVPLFLLLVSSGFWHRLHHSKARRLFIVLTSIMIGIITLACFLVFNSGFGRDGYPIDSEGRIITLADEINALPFGAIVYDHWRGWELGYYLGAWSDKRRVYYPDPITQAQDSLNNPEMATRYFIAPAMEYYEIWLTAMQDVGYKVSVYKQIGNPYPVQPSESNGFSMFAYDGFNRYIIFALEPPPR